MLGNTLEDPLADCLWQALETSHRELALRNGRARRYPAAVAPFAAIAEPSGSSLRDLAPLLHPGESVYLMGEHLPEIPALERDGMVACLQMVFPSHAPLPPVPSGLSVESLDCRHAQEMLDLTGIAFPGYFRPETCRMGRYFGLRDPAGSLVAMGGERIVLATPQQGVWREISGLCSHPDQAGRRLGAAVLAHILSLHRSEGSVSWLHVVDNNARAIALYHRLGFRTLRRVELHRVRRII